MSEFVIRGGTPLHGSVRLGGAKNASFKIMIAALLSEGETRLLNFSHIRDVEVTKQIIEKLGVKVYTAGERTLFIHPEKIQTHVVDLELGSKSRASSMFLAPLLHRVKKAIVPLPGGDAIGHRPLDRHIQGLEAFGAQIQVKDNAIEAELVDGFIGAEYTFEKVTHTGTETILMAAAVAKGNSTLHNTALEPEVEDLIEFLNKMGAKIRRTTGRTIEVEGVQTLKPTIHRIIPDRNEAVSYACAAIATRGDIIVENARPDHLAAFLQVLDQVGAGYESGDYGVRFFHKGPLKAVDVTTMPHPGFMTDWQPLLAVVLTQAEGASSIHETVMESRFQYGEMLNKIGAQTELFEPEIDSPKELYQFPYDAAAEHKHAIRITGPTPLRAGEHLVPDIRAGATLVLASMIADGESVLKDIYHIERGYEELDSRLRSMGADIRRYE